MGAMKILVVDDEALQRDLLRGFLENNGYEVATAAGGREALKMFERQAFALVLLDHRMPDLAGDEVLARMREINPLVRSVMITAYGSVDTAVRVMKIGADDFLEKPVDLKELLDKIRMIEQALAIEEEAADVTEVMDTGRLPVRVIGKSAALKEALSLVQRVAPTEWSTLIRGETGTGKELIARLIHLMSPRAQGPFIEVNCAAIPETLFESELFGHEKGAFTGAAARRRGRFELAGGGSLFLDEIGELPLTLQAKLLRTLQEKEITPVGSEKAVAVDVRVLAATNRDLKKMVAEGSFREDLYYRIKVLEIEIPPLRSRREDIPELVDYFLSRYGVDRKTFDAEAMAVLIKYAFPGNVRELEHIVQRTVTLCRTNVIRAADLPPEVRFYQGAGDGGLAERLETVEREMLIEALEKSGWVQTRAARSLGISERVLRYKMKKHGLKEQGPS
jgi:two-component system response regulator AtoC